MVRLIMGTNGAGKTKQLIELIKQNAEDDDPCVKDAQLIVFGKLWHNDLKITQRIGGEAC